MSSGEAGDDRALDLPGDRADGLEVARRGDREARFDDVDTQARELVGDLELLVRVERDAGRLLAVAQRGVEDDDPVRVVRRGHAMGSLKSRSWSCLVLVRGFGRPPRAVTPPAGGGGEVEGGRGGAPCGAGGYQLRSGAQKMR